MCGIGLLSGFTNPKMSKSFFRFYSVDAHYKLGRVFTHFLKIVQQYLNQFHIYPATLPCLEK